MTCIIALFFPDALFMPDQHWFVIICFWSPENNLCTPKDPDHHFCGLNSGNFLWSRHAGIIFLSQLKSITPFIIAPEINYTASEHFIYIVDDSMNFIQFKKGRFMMVSTNPATLMGFSWSAAVSILQ